MFKLIRNFTLTILACTIFAFSANAQNDTKVVMNADGSYSVIEYPVDKDVEVRLVPMKGINGTGMAHVMRTAKGSRVVFDLNGAPSDWKELHAYAVDPSGSTTYLGPITFNSGAGKAEFMTPASQFMLVLSPTQGMTTYDPTTGYYFRSDVPQGFTVVPRMKISGTPMTSSDVAVSSVDVTTTTYDVPMLGIRQYAGKETAFRLNFDGDLKGLEAKAYIKPVAGKSQIRMHFDDMQKVPLGKRFVLWTAGPQGYTKVGQVIHAGKKDTAEIRGESALSDFGLFMTVEDNDVDRPTSRVYSSFRYVAP
jgi:hypothetical protein